MSSYICIGFIGLIVALFVWSFVPILIVRRFKTNSLKDNADIEDNYRKTMGQAIGAVALIVTFGWTFFKDRESIDLSRKQFRVQAEQFSEQQTQARDQFVNQQFITAAGLLKEGSISTRIAGLYGIDQIASVKPREGKGNEYLIPALRAAVGYIKNPVISTGTRPEADNQPILADTQSAITVLGHLNENRTIEVDLRGAYLVHSDFKLAKTKAFTASNFQGATLYGADMGDLDLTGAKFDGSFTADWEAYGAKWRSITQEDYENTRQDNTIRFDNAMLADTGFDHVNMGGASFANACLAGARFWATDLSRAIFTNAKLGNNPGCNFKDKKAHFYQAVLIDANFDGVDVDGVDFQQTKLAGAQFSKALNVGTATFNGACVDKKTEFPPSFKINLPTCREAKSCRPAPRC